MGHGRWDEDSRVTYRSFADTATKAHGVRDVYTSTKMNTVLDPKGIKIRESCDSEDNPNSNAIIIGLDVTGSMGMIAHSLAKEGLGTLIEGIIDTKPVEDPHIMFMAIGDEIFDSAPLQVSQFEPDIRIVQQLKDIYVEQGGGGNDVEGYHLPWYFAANLTKIDCFDKRGRKGYLFTVGDELPPKGLTKRDIKKVFGVDVQTDYTSAELLEKASEQYHVFHLIVEQGSFAHRALPRVTGQWRELLGKRAVLLSDYNHMSQVILSIMKVSEGENPEEVVASWEDRAIRETVKHALFD